MWIYWLLEFGIVVVILIQLRKWIRGGQFSEEARADGKVAVVTGANSGVGRALCGELNRRGAKVYMLCRNEKRANQAIEQLVGEDGCDESRLLYKHMDLQDFSSIKRMAQELKQEEPVIDILINNAGLLGVPRFEKTVDGFEKTWQSNYLGHFLLTELLVPALARSKDGRIVNVSSIMHAHADSVFLSVVNSPSRYGRMMSYNRSKLANVIHALHLSRVFGEEGVNVKVASCHPGNINSNILSESGWLALKFIFKPIFWYCFKTERDGAQTPLHLALTEHPLKNGEYYSDCKLSEMHPKSRCLETGEQLYKESMIAVSSHLPMTAT